MEDKFLPDVDFGRIDQKETWRDGVIRFAKENYGYVPNYPKPIDTNPFNLIEGNENKLY